ncbi:MAG: hypothetical protein FWC61_03580 [Proteobacteria bacterium]|nr:hypothetical protein [Pseudomonadota bacterium]
MKKLFAFLCLFIAAAGFTSGSRAGFTSGGQDVASTLKLVSQALTSATCANTGPIIAETVISSGTKDGCVVDNCSGYKLTCDNGFFFNSYTDNCSKIGEGNIIANRYGYITKCGKWGTWGDSAWGWGGAGKDTPNMCADFKTKSALPANAEGFTSKESGIPCWKWQCKSTHVLLEENTTCITPAECAGKGYAVSPDGEKCVAGGCPGKLIKNSDKSCVTADQCKAATGCSVSADNKYCNCDTDKLQPEKVGGCPSGRCRQATDTGDICSGSIQDTTPGGQFVDSDGKCQKCPTNYFPTYNADGNLWKCSPGLIAYAVEMRACWDCAMAVGFKQCVKSKGADRSQCAITAGNDNNNPRK